MGKYKVEYIHSEKVKSKWYQGTKTHVDTWSLAKELEALLIDYEERNYRVLTIEPVVVPIACGNGAGSKTDGFMVVFEKE